MPEATRAEVYAALDSERDYQEMRIARDGTTAPKIVGGLQVVQLPHSPEDYLIYMDVYLTEAKRTAAHTWGPTSPAAIMEVLRKVVALGVAAMEVHGAPQRAGFERPVVEFYSPIRADDEIPF